EPCGGGVRATLADGREIIADAALAATGLRPETALARRAGLTVNRGIQVNSRLQTSDPHIFALGDCAEINGALLPFLQPILLSAMCLAKNLLNQTAALALPPMLVKVKTPELPLQLAGDAGRPDLSWHIVSNAGGMVAKGVDDAGKLCAFAVSEGRMKEAFALLKSLS
ncbi:TPA: FAD-dependent oxidoreductase, partial [Pluralibacter gergoviae]|nr:FAD-dependent oxidoreductase [Pluralibacter gergoviae]